MPFFQNIETERLYLRTPKKKDIPYQFEYQKNPKNFPFADLEVFTKFEDAEKLWEKMSGLTKAHKSLFWVLEEKKSNLPVGTLSAWNIDVEKNSIEFGYSLYPNSRGNGYMYEAIKAAIKYLHRELGFTVFDIWTDKDNIQSVKLAKRLGFKFMRYVDEEAHNSKRIITYATHSLKYLEEKRNPHGKI